MKEVMMENGHNNNAATEEEQMNAYYEAFQALILSTMNKLGVDENCQVTENPDWDAERREGHDELLEYLGYDEIFEKAVAEEIGYYSAAVREPSVPGFVHAFLPRFHNLMIAGHLEEQTRERNENLANAYGQIVDAISMMQGWLDEEPLRVRIESDLKESGIHRSTIFQCTTPFSVVSLGCDPRGKFNIVYTLDHRINEMIGRHFASMLVRRIYEFTPGEMEPYLQFKSLNADCIGIFESFLQLAENEGNHTVRVQEQFDD